MVDPKTTYETKKVYEYLQTMKGNQILFGHQNTTSSGVLIQSQDGDESDVEMLVGDYPAVYGWDTLALIGEEGTYEQLKQWVEKASARGGIITMSAHMLNPMTGGSFNEIKGEEVKYILTYQGEVFERFKAHLDLFAQFASEVKLPNNHPVPIIFRPFHEHSGSWFWWGKDHCSELEFIELFQYTVDYLKETKDLHNLIYAYSPNGHFKNSQDYLNRYPGDDYIDLLGFDMYHDKPQREDGWIEAFVKDCEIIARLAEEKNKIGAITEVGIRWNADERGLATNQNAIPDWYTWLLGAIKENEWARQMVYMLNWWNGANGQFWVPYKGHEMASDFISFYQDSFTRFNKAQKDIYEIREIGNIDGILADENLNRI